MKFAPSAFKCKTFLSSKQEFLERNMASYCVKFLVSSFILALVMTCATSARILDEEVPVAPVVAPGDPETDASPASSVSPVAITGGATAGAVAAKTGAAKEVPVAPVVAPGDPETDASPASSVSPVAITGGATAGAVAAKTGAATGALPATPATKGVAAAKAGHTLKFFMHDILGGSTPSATAVTGVVNNPAVNGQVPFAKRSGANLPVNNGVPQDNNANGAIINNNNIPFLTGLSGTMPNVIQNNGNDNSQLPTRPALHKLTFGTMTVFDDELTEGEKLGSGMVGKAQGFYVTSGQDGLSQTMAFTVMFESGAYSDSLSFFGIHRTAVSQCHLAIMGGTGKYVNAKGLATVKTFPATNQLGGNGVESVLEIIVYLSY